LRATTPRAASAIFSALRPYCSSNSSQRLSHEASQAAVHQVVLGGDNGAGLPGRCQHRLHIQGLEGRHVENAAIDALRGEKLGRLQGLPHHHPDGHHGYVLAGTREVGLAQPELVALAVDGRNLGTHAADIEGAGVAGGYLDGLLRLYHIGGHYNPKAGKREHQGKVIDGLSGGTVLAGGYAGVAAHQLNVQARLGNAQAELVEAAAGSEDSEGADEHSLARRRQASGHVHHVLLGHAYREEALREDLAELASSGGAAQVGIHDHDVQPLLTQTNEGWPHGLAGGRCLGGHPRPTPPGPSQPAPAWALCRGRQGCSP
jgi:hypothetical protein